MWLSDGPRDVTLRWFSGCDSQMVLGMWLGSIEKWDCYPVTKWNNQLWTNFMVSTSSTWSIQRSTEVLRIHWSRENYHRLWNQDLSEYTWYRFLIISVAAVRSYLASTTQVCIFFVGTVWTRKKTCRITKANLYVFLELSRQEYIGLLVSLSLRLLWNMEGCPDTIHFSEKSCVLFLEFLEGYSGKNAPVFLFLREFLECFPDKNSSIFYSWWVA